MRSGGFSRNAKPSASVSRSGNAKTQNTASGSRPNSLRREIVISTSGWYVGAFRGSDIAQLPSGQRYEQIFERSRVSRQRLQLRAAAVDDGQELRHRRRQRIDAQLPSIAALRRAVKSRDVGERALLELRNAHE